MTNTPSKNNDQTSDEILSEANLWNPLWAYDLFPMAQSSWNRMPIVGADFETESSAQPPQPNPDPNSEPNPDEQENAGTAPEGPEPDEENDTEETEETGDDESDGDNNNETDSNDENEEDSEGDEPSNDGDENNNEDDDDDENGSSDLDEDEPEDPDDDPDDDDSDIDAPDLDPDRNNEYALEEPKSSGPPPIPGFTLLQTNAGLEYIREFDSWFDFVECAADESLYAWKHTRQSHVLKQNNAGASASWNEAIEMARFRGWPEGRKLLSDLMANIAMKTENFETWTFDVAGIFPIVPAFLSGDPACMIVDPGNDLRTQYPIIRIDYNHGVSWDITPKDMMTRGAAVLSLANNLEAHGFQTELRIVDNHSGYNKNHEPVIFRYSVVYKKPGQFIDLDRAAFAIAHPACLRRLGFALLEQHADLEAGSFGDNYGYPMHQSNDPDAGTFGIIFVPGSRGNETEAKSAAVVLAAANATISILEASS